MQLYFYFGATADNSKDLASLKDLEVVVVLNFAGSSTGNLLVAEEGDIDKVFQNSSKVVAVHSEDESILNVNKKLIKRVMFIPIQFGEALNVQ